MQDELVAYFAGEKQAAVLVAGIGVVNVIAAIVLIQPRWELRAMAITLGVVGLLELALGIGLFARTGPQVERLLAQLGSDAAGLHAGEAARMTRVQQSFQTLQIVWTILIAAACVVATTQKGRPVVWGVALGLLVNLAFLMVFDLVAERRGAAYLAALSRPVSASP